MRHNKYFRVRGLLLRGKTLWGVRLSYHKKTSQYSPLITEKTCLWLSFIKWSLYEQLSLEDRWKWYQLLALQWRRADIACCIFPNGKRLVTNDNADLYFSFYQVSPWPTYQKKWSRKVNNTRALIGRRLLADWKNSACNIDSGAAVFCHWCAQKWYSFSWGATTCVVLYSSSGIVCAVVTWTRYNRDYLTLIVVKYSNTKPCTWKSTIILWFL